MIYTITRMAIPVAALLLWAWLSDGTVADPANLFLPFAAVSGALAFVSVRRYWRVRNTSRSRRDSSSLYP